MTRTGTSAILRGVLAAGLFIAAGCESNNSATPGGATGGGGTGGSGATGGTGGGGGGFVDAGDNRQDSGSPSVDTGTPTDTGSTPPADASDARPQDAMTPGSEVGGDAPAGGKKPVAPSTGCGAANQLPEGNATLPSGRRYIVHLPTAYNPTKAYPLVFANHPNGGGIGMFDDQGTRTAMRDWAILVLTQSQTGDWRTAFPADLAYFDALVPLLKEGLCVDTNRVYSFGFSGGGSFSNLLACQRDFLSAMGSGGGIPGYNGQTADQCKPMPAWIDEGDRVGMVEQWTAKNGCTESVPGSRPNCRNYTCAIAPVIYCTNGAHTWPGNASGDVAAFFKQF